MSLSKRDGDEKPFSVYTNAAAMSDLFNCIDDGATHKSFMNENKNHTQGDVEQEPDKEFFFLFSYQRSSSSYR